MKSALRESLDQFFGKEPDARGQAQGERAGSGVAQLTLSPVTDTASSRVFPEVALTEM